MGWVIRDLRMIWWGRGFACPYNRYHFSECMRCDHFNFCFAVSTKSGTRAGLRTLYFSTGIVHLSWLLSLSLSLSLSPSLSICFEQGVAPRRMATGEPQYWSFICPGQCDKVVMLFCLGLG